MFDMILDTGVGYRIRREMCIQRGKFIARKNPEVGDKLLFGRKVD